MLSTYMYICIISSGWLTIGMWGLCATCHFKVPWCLLVSSHTGPSLPPAPPLFSSAALHLGANPADKKNKNKTAQSIFYFICLFFPSQILQCKVMQMSSQLFWKMPKLQSNVRTKINEMYICWHIHGRVFKHQVHIQCSYKGLQGWTVQWLI